MTGSKCLCYPKISLWKPHISGDGMRGWCFGKVINHRDPRVPSARRGHCREVCMRNGAPNLPMPSTKSWVLRAGMLAPLLYDKKGRDMKMYYDLLGFT